MAKEKDTYSLISVDVAPDDEVVRVDAQGVHRETSDSVPVAPAAAAADSAAAPHEEAPSEPVTQKAERGASSAKRASDESYDARDDLEGPVPMAGMQRAIIVAVVVCLVAFAVYFVVSRG